MRRIHCDTLQQRDKLVRRIEFACGSAYWHLDWYYAGDATTLRPLGYWVVYTDDVPECALDQEFNVRSLLNHLSECFDWSHETDAAVRLGLNVGELGKLVGHCTEQGWVQRGAHKSLLRITVAGRQVLTRTLSMP